MFSYTSLNILNVLLTSLCLFSSFAVLFETPVCIPPLSNSTTVFFFLSYILGIGSYFFLISALFLLLYSFFHTLYTVPLLSLPSLLLPLFSSMLSGKGCTTYFLLVFQEETFIPDFYRFKPPCLYILYTLHRLLLSSL